MKQNLHIIVNCTNRKSAKVPKELRLRAVPRGTLEERAAEWLRRLDSHPSEGIPAEALYAGDHWVIVRNLPRLAKQGNFTPRLWVISAGYGLVESSERLRPYSATFTSGHQDSILKSKMVTGDRRALLCRWWAKLGAAGGARKPRSLAQLVKQNKNAYYLIVTSPTYLNAVSEDLSEAISLLKEDRLVIVSSRLAATGDRWRPYLIPADARLQDEVGGARNSLNARVAEKVLAHAAEYGFDPVTLRKKIEHQIIASPELMKYDRQRADDVSVRNYIIGKLQAMPAVSCTALLRQYRDAGQACEQSRFKKLYWEAKKRS
ncbi:MAG: hypothetical protein JST84_05605 [Acidobacteria bacterium]|nr:hypothetical protein [Acidobacteriota bacterium]